MADDNNDPDAVEMPFDEYMDEALSRLIVGLEGTRTHWETARKADSAWGEDAQEQIAAIHRHLDLTIQGAIQVKGTLMEYTSPDTIMALMVEAIQQRSGQEVEVVGQVNGDIDGETHAMGFLLRLKDPAESVEEALEGLRKDMGSGDGSSQP